MIFQSEIVSILTRIDSHSPSTARGQNLLSQEALRDQSQTAIPTEPGVPGGSDSRPQWTSGRNAASRESHGTPLCVTSRAESKWERIR